MIRLAMAGFCAVWLTACSYVIPLSPRFRHEAAENHLHAAALRLGQTPDEVRAIMQKDPERRDVRRRFDGKTVEMWGYATDYVRRLDTTITFVDGHVEEIKTLPWFEAD